MLAAGGVVGVLGVPANHNAVGVAIIAAAMLVSSLIVTVIPGWFGWRALTQPGRDLHRLLDRLDSIEEVARLAAMLQESHNTFLRAYYQHRAVHHPPRAKPPVDGPLMASARRQPTSVPKIQYLSEMP